MIRKTAIATTLFLATLTLPVLAQSQYTLPLYASHPYVAQSVKEQQFEDNLTLKPNQEKLPLMLFIKNGGNGKPGLKWFRLNAAGYLMATEKDLNGQPEAGIDVTGRMQPGTSQVIIEAAGEPGSQMQYWVSTVPVSVRSVQPANAMPGQEVIIRGSNFSTDETQDSAYINGKQMQILSAGKTSITAVVPNNIGSGAANLTVAVNGVQSPAFPLSVTSLPQPVITGSDYWMAPPGAQLTITGANFASDFNADKVYFRNVQARVVGGNSNSIVVVIPNWAYGNSELNIPVTVFANGVRSSNTMPFDIGPKYLGQMPMMPGDSSSEASNEFSAPQSTSAATSQSTVNSSSESSTQSSNSSQLIIEQP